MMRELKRQSFHLMLGIIALIVLVFFGRGFLMGGTFFAMLIGFILVNRVLLGERIEIMEWFMKEFERKDVRFPGWGSACYGLGILFISGFLHEQNEIAASLVVLALGDGFSTLIGKMGNYRLPWSKSKTVEGAAAFFIGGIFGYFFVGWAILPVVFVAMLVESIDWPIDDNLMVPIVCTIMFWIL